MSTILVTGSLGFIGQKICRTLNNQYKIIAVDGIDSLDFEVEDFYEYVEEEEALTERKEIVENV